MLDYFSKPVRAYAVRRPEERVLPSRGWRQALAQEDVRAAVELGLERKNVLQVGVIGEGHKFLEDMSAKNRPYVLFSLFPQKPTIGYAGFWVAGFKGALPEYPFIWVWESLRKNCSCIVRESNPGRPRGRRAFYH